jgi:hypothetical protein
MPDTVAQLTPSELQELIEDAVERKLDELLGDPDAGRELREEIRTRLLDQQRAIDSGQYGVSLEEAARQFGLQA